MEITVRTLLASVSATAVLGGAIGALATAATTSQANATAVAAAVQRVSDQKAEQLLKAANTGLDILHIDQELLKNDESGVKSTLESIEKSAISIQKNASGTCWAVSSEAQRAADCAP
jgi:hypothetical protein